MEREIIKLDNEQWENLVHENYLEIDGTKIEITEIKREYLDSGRHTESHNLVFQRKSDGKFFSIGYDTSVKDSMGWNECNYGETKATEVFAERVTKVIYN